MTNIATQQGPADMDIPGAKDAIEEIGPPPRQKSKIWMIRLTSVAFFLGAWEIGGRQVDPLFMSYPSEISRSAVRLVMSGELGSALASSLQTLIFAFVIASVVGVSLGLERLLVVMEERGMLPGVGTRTRALVTRFSAELDPPTLQLAAELRGAGLDVETWLGAPGKLGKQFQYADSRRIPYAVVLGPDELAEGVVALKHLGTGEQTRVARAALPEVLRG